MRNGLPAFAVKQLAGFAARAVSHIKPQDFQSTEAGASETHSFSLHTPAKPEGFSMFTARTSLVGKLSLAAVLTVSADASVSLAAVEVTVNGNEGPWVYSTGLNTSFPYNQGFGATAAPTVVATSSQVTIAAGSVVSINYVSGSVSVEPGAYPFTDAAGNT